MSGRAPGREQDGTTWSLTTLQWFLRPEPPALSTYTLQGALHGTGLSWQKSRIWCQTKQVWRVRRDRDAGTGTPGPGRRDRDAGTGTAEAVDVTSPDAEAKKLIGDAHRLGAG